MLRGINLPRRNRVSMPELRFALEAAGFVDVATYLQSGNAVLSHEGGEIEVARRCEEAIRSAFGLDIKVVARGHQALTEVVALNPLSAVATNPKRHLVVFFEDQPPADLQDRMQAAMAPGETFAIHDREAYLWIPESIQRSRLWGLDPRAVSTARNWNTVEALAALTR